MQRRDLAVQEVPFRGSSGGNIPAGKFVSCDLRGRLPKAALPPESELKAGRTGKPRFRGYARHSEAEDTSCAVPAAPHPAGPLARGREWRAANSA